jgi:EAL domain-containing protein (putative c-di-GMP-specific phosphodiesterase class I)
MGLADNLGMGVIAEGVETEEQLQELLGLGCVFGQGSLFYEPLSPELVDDILS